MALQTYNVNVGSNFEFKIGDVIKLTLKDGYTFQSSVIPNVDDNFSTGPADPVQAAIADPTTGSLVVFGREYSGDNIDANKFTPKYKITWNPVAIAAEGHTDGLDGLVDATKIQVLRNEVVSAKSKTVVTKERLTYYHNKIKAWLDTKGKIKSIQMGPNTYTPNADGLVNIPGNIVQMEDTANDITLVGKKAVYENGVNTYANKNLKFDFSQTDKLEISRWVNTETPTVYNLPSTGYVDTLAAAATKLKLEKVDSLPATGEEGKIYLVPNTGAGVNVYDEYFWYNKGTDTNPDYVFELFGTTAVDLTNYIQETDLVEITTSEIDDMFATTP